jgi:hypothetical protein
MMAEFASPGLREALEEILRHSYPDRKTRKELEASAIAICDIANAALAASPDDGWVKVERLPVELKLGDEIRETMVIENVSAGGGVTVPAKFKKLAVEYRRCPSASTGSAEQQPTKGG